MNPKLLEAEIQKFIKDNEKSRVTDLALTKNPFPHVNWHEILNQIVARQKAKYKLPTWYNTDSILYPEKVAVEQTSSETAADYKSKLISGDSLIDLTGGFGIDDYYFSKTVKEVSHCEQNLELSATAAHNFKALGADTITCVPGDSTEALRLLNRQWDWIYIDPSRRSETKGKVFLLKDCLPDVPALLDFYFRYTHNIMIKTAPLLDISAGLGELHAVKAIHIIAVTNEVKELLWILEKGFEGSPLIVAASITDEGTDTFTAEWNDSTQAVYAAPELYLYEPNSAIMKSGAFGAVGTHFNVKKLHQHSQLYTSHELKAFPGRRFKINKILPYQKKEMKQYIEGNKMNVTVRNFPLGVTDLKKKWKIKDGGDRYTFFTTDLHDNKIVLLCAKI